MVDTSSGSSAAGGVIVPHAAAAAACHAAASYDSHSAAHSRQPSGASSSSYSGGGGGGVAHLSPSSSPALFSRQHAAAFTASPAAAAAATVRGRRGSPGALHLALPIGPGHLRGDSLSSAGSGSDLCPSTPDLPPASPGLNGSPPTPAQRTLRPPRSAGTRAWPLEPLSPAVLRVRAQVRPGASASSSPASRPIDLGRASEYLGAPIPLAPTSHPATLAATREQPAFLDLDAESFALPPASSRNSRNGADHHHAEQSLTEQLYAAQWAAPSDMHSSPLGLHSPASMVSFPSDDRVGLGSLSSSSMMELGLGRALSHAPLGREESRAPETARARSLESHRTSLSLNLGALGVSGDDGGELGADSDDEGCPPDLRSPRPTYTPAQISAQIQAARLMASCPASPGSFGEQNHPSSIPRSPAFHFAASSPTSPTSAESFRTRSFSVHQTPLHPPLHGQGAGHYGGDLSPSTASPLRPRVGKSSARLTSVFDLNSNHAAAYLNRALPIVASPSQGPTLSSTPSMSRLAIAGASSAASVTPSFSSSSATNNSHTTTMPSLSLRYTARSGSPSPVPGARPPHPAARSARSSIISTVPRSFPDC